MHDEPVRRSRTGSLARSVGDRANTDLGEKFPLRISRQAEGRADRADISFSRREIGEHRRFAQVLPDSLERVGFEDWPNIV